MGPAPADGDDVEGDEPFQAVVTAACALVGGRRAALFAYDPDADELEGLAARGLPPGAVAGVRLALADSPLAAGALERREPATGAETSTGELLAGLGLELCVPLLAGGEPVGVLFLGGGGASQAGRGTPLAAFAEVAAAAVASLGERVFAPRRPEDVRSLLEVATVIVSTLDVGEVLRRIAWGARTLLGVPRAAILAYEPATGTLRGVTGAGLGEEVGALQVPLADSRSARAAVTRRAACHPEEEEGGDELGRRLAIAAFACLPLHSHDDVLGVLVVEEPLERFRRHAALASDFAGVASIALENARLYRQALGTTALVDASRAAQDLHDGVAQALFGITSGAEALLAGEPRAEARTALETVKALALRASRDVREAIQSLRGDKHVLLGLGQALEELASAVRNRTGLEIEREVAPYLAEANDAVADVLYRICREGLANVERHARASWCRVSCTVEDGVARASVEDDGVGTPREARAGEHFGIEFLRETVEALGGSLEFGPRAPRGSVLAGRVPLERDVPAPIR